MILIAKYVKSIFVKVTDTKCVKFVKKLVSKETVNKILKTISNLLNNIGSLVKMAGFKVTDRVKATNAYAYTVRGWLKYKQSSIPVKVLSVLAMVVVIFAVGFGASGATIAYNVSYGGQVIGAVGSKRLCAAAVKLAVGEIGKDAGSEISDLKTSLVITFKNRLASKQDIKDAILENTDTVAFASLLKVDGKEIVYVSDEGLEQYLEDYRDSFNIDGSVSKSEFVESVEIETGYFVTDDIYKLEEAKQLIASSITVKTQATLVSEQAIAFGTTTQKTSSQLLGYSKVISAGVNGIRLNTDEVVYVNGVETERSNVFSVVTKNPVNQVVMVGTAKSLASASQRAEASSYGFIFPLDKSSRWKVSSYYGDGRNHKGIDICAPYKTKIYAVASGVVTFASYKSDYGYLVIIDHGNGISTAYAHASVLGVRKGDRVSAGETIALVGSTGNSTGNHLHFEVRKGEVRVDPSPYIGLS